MTQKQRAEVLQRFSAKLEILLKKDLRLMKPSKTIILTEDQFETLFEFVDQKVESIDKELNASVNYQDSDRY